MERNKLAREAKNAPTDPHIKMGRVMMGAGVIGSTVSAMHHILENHIDIQQVMHGELGEVLGQLLQYRNFYIPFSFIFSGGIMILIGNHITTKMRTKKLLEGKK